MRASSPPSSQVQFESSTPSSSARSTVAIQAVAQFQLATERRTYRQVRRRFLRGRRAHLTPHNRCHRPRHALAIRLYYFLAFRTPSSVSAVRHLRAAVRANPDHSSPRCAPGSRSARCARCAECSFAPSSWCRCKWVCSGGLPRAHPPASSNHIPSDYC